MKEPSRLEVRPKFNTQHSMLVYVEISNLFVEAFDNVTVDKSPLHSE